jgi:hypothetical protein
LGKILEEYITPDQVEKAFGVPKTTLSNWRWLHKGPAWVKFGHRVLYPLDKFKEYLDAHLVDPE